MNGIDTSPISINITGSASNNGIPGQGATTGIAVAGGLVRLNSQANGRGAPYTPWTLSFIDNLTWISGKHTMKFGGEIRPCASIRTVTEERSTPINSLSDFLVNRLASFRYVGDLSDPSVFNNGATGQREGKQEYYIAYAQDEWKVASNVTLNYGMRFEHYTPMREARNLDVQFNINCTTTPDCFLPTNHPFYQSRMNFDPRIGLTLFAGSENFDSRRFRSLQWSRPDGRSSAAHRKRFDQYRRQRGHIPDRCQRRPRELHQ